MSKRLNFEYILFQIIILSGLALSQNLPLEVKINFQHQNVFDKKDTDSEDYTGFGFPYLGLPDKNDGGFGLGTEFRFKINEQFRVLLQVNYDNMYLYQDDVLDEWEWDYWEDTYIEFLPGITVEEINRRLEYNSGDSIYSAIFEPRQRLKELRLSSGFSYTRQLLPKLDGFAALEIGASLYTRELRMTEKWTKRFKLDTVSTGRFDYEYNYDLVHFAPSKNGARFYAAPVLGLKYHMGDFTDLELSYRYLQYLDSDYSGWLEDFFRFSNNSEKWFPLYSKYQIELGVVFRY